MEQTEIKSVGRFELKRLLAHEGRVPVYLAVDPTYARNVALKLVNLNGSGLGARKEFEHRAHLMEGLRHTNLCPVLEVGRIGELDYLAMAYIKGVTLIDIAKRKAVLQPNQVALLVGKLALAVHHMHRAGLVNGFLSLQSVVIDTSGEPVIVDLGLARAFPAEGELETSAPYLEFLSPEVQISGGADAQFASDIYSIAAIGFTMLTGRTPTSADDVSGALLPSILDEQLSARLKEVFTRALAFEPSARYDTALEFATAMDKLFRALSKQVPKVDSVEQPAKENEPQPSEFAQFDFQQIEDSFIVHLHDASVLSSEAIAQSQNELFELVETYSPHRLIINFASVQFCSSATVGVLIQLKNELKSKGTLLYLCGMRDSIREVFRVLNLDGSVFEIRATVANALKSAE